MMRRQALDLLRAALGEIDALSDVLAPGRPRIPPALQHLIRKMARDNPSWDEERIANELLLKLGVTSQNLNPDILMMQPTQN